MFVQNMYHKTTPPDVNQHRVVKAVLGKARFFFFCGQCKGLPSGYTEKSQTIIIQDELKSCQCNSPSFALEELLEGDIDAYMYLSFELSHMSLERNFIFGSMN